MAFPVDMTLFVLKYDDDRTSNRPTKICPTFLNLGPWRFIPEFIITNSTMNVISIYQSNNCSCIESSFMLCSTMGDVTSASITQLQERVWVTIVTRASYLPGAIILAHSLHKQKSKYSLLILTTPSFPAALLPILDREVTLTNSQLLSIEPLSPPPENTPASLIAARFEDTWTKLRVFELFKHGYKKLVFLDADMLVLRNMDELFEFDLPGIDWIAANHACVCNLDGDSWAPKDWTKENCAYSGLKPESAATPVPALEGNEGENAWETPHRRLNSGMFIFSPNHRTWEKLLSFLNTRKMVREFLFPDQDLLAAFFLGRWKSIGWEYNALKTMRYWHKSMWSDAKVKNLHYIVDKPWNQRIDDDGIAGYLGRDGTTHSWWWTQYDLWESERMEMGETMILDMVRKEVAKPLNYLEPESTKYPDRNGEAVPGQVKIR